MQLNQHRGSLLAVLTISGLALFVPSCGGDDDDDDGDAGSAGTAGAGRSGAGGSPIGGGGTGGTAGRAGGGSGGTSGAGRGGGGTGGLPQGGAGSGGDAGAGAGAGAGGDAGGGVGGDTGGSGAGGVGGVGGDGGTGGEPDPFPGVMGNFGFETGLEGWEITGGTDVVLSQSTDRAFSGTNSLKVDYSLRDDGAGGAGGAPPALPAINPIVRVIGPAVLPGTQVTFHIYPTEAVPTGTGNNYVQLVVQSRADFTSFVSQSITLTPNQWNTVVLSIPMNTVPPIQNLGFQAGVTDYTGIIYIDAVTW